MNRLRWDEVVPLGAVTISNGIGGFGGSSGFGGGGASSNVATNIAGGHLNCNNKSGLNQHNIKIINLDWWWWLLIVGLIFILVAVVVLVYCCCLKERNDIYKILPKRKYGRESTNPFIPLVAVNRNSGTTVFTDEDCRTDYNSFPMNATTIDASRKKIA
jgi:hypothetical protein